MQIDCGNVATLAPNGATTCTATGDNQYVDNVSSASAKSDAVTKSTVADWHTVHGRNDIDLDIVINGAIAEIPPGVWVATGNDLTIEYRLTNRGNVVITNLAIDNGQPVSCSLPDSLEPGATWSGCAVTMSDAKSGPFKLTATVTGSNGVTESAVGYYVGYDSVSGQ